MASIGNLTIKLEFDNPEAIQFLENVFELMDDLEDLVPEWQQFELKKLAEKRQALADQATELMTLDDE